MLGPLQAGPCNVFRAEIMKNFKLLKKNLKHPLKTEIRHVTCVPQVKTEWEAKMHPTSFCKLKLIFFFRVTWSKEIYKSAQIIYLSSVPVSFSFPLNSEVLPVSLQRPCDNVTNIRAAKC